MSDFGDRLREAMEKEKLTASELAKITGIGKNLISYYINGKCIGKQDKIYLLAKALHVDPGWLITGVQPRKRQENYQPETEEARFVSIAMDKMPTEEREKAVNVLKAMYCDFFNDAEGKIG